MISGHQHKWPTLKSFILIAEPEHSHPTSYYRVGDLHMYSLLRGWLTANGCQKKKNQQQHMIKPFHSLIVCANNKTGHKSNSEVEKCLLPFLVLRLRNCPNIYTTAVVALHGWWHSVTRKMWNSNPPLTRQGRGIGHFFNWMEGGLSFGSNDQCVLIPHLVFVLPLCSVY